MTAWVPVLPRPGSRAVLGAGLAACGAVFSLVLLFTVVGQPSSPPSESVNTSQVPSAYLPWVQSAGSLCAVITPAVIAAQDQVESDWNPRAVSPAGAEGIAQFLPGTFATWGQDSDGTGDVSPFNPADEIMAQGRYDCSLASLMLALEGAGQVSGDVLSLALAAYNAGPGAVEAAHGVPGYAAGTRSRSSHWPPPSTRGRSPREAGRARSRSRRLSRHWGRRTSGADRALTRTDRIRAGGVTARRWCRWRGPRPGCHCRAPRLRRLTSGRRLHRSQAWSLGT